ncbi:MAG: hypothetical protein KJ064_20500 [Anaerolineae bacterium]|nr:MAG: hypothetical protein F9K27_12925 [Anaerolineae bacterium]MCL4879050.1 hypothetical protein [Anaerolineae bacterium]
MEISLNDNNKRTLGAVALIGIGLLLLLGLSKLWPLFLLLPGLGLMALAYSENKSLAPLAVPGMLVSGTGGMMLFQAVTGYWESWAFSWTLYGVFFGLGLMIMGERMEVHDLRVIGRWFTIISAIAFAGLGTLFMLATSAVIRLLFIVACFVVGFKLLCKEKQHRLHTNGNGVKMKHSDVVVEENIERMKVRLGKDEVI